jgi:hypothetical protein
MKCSSYKMGDSSKTEVAKAGRLRIEYVFDEFAQLAVDPVGVRNDEAETVFVVGQIDGNVEAVAQGDAFPGDVQQSRSVPELVQGGLFAIYLLEAF